MINLEKFLSLPIEKQNHIIDAALMVFGRNGYKKASISDIAVAAGISKAMVFYYFGNKKSLYLYLINLCRNIMVSEIKKNLDKSVTDFFDKIRIASEIKVAVMKKHLPITLFIKSFYYETDPEIESDIKKIIAESENYSTQFVFDGTDISKFKDDIDPMLIMKFLIWASEGATGDLFKNTSTEDIDEFMKDFIKLLNIMKTNLYKESANTAK